MNSARQSPLMHSRAYTISASLVLFFLIVARTLSLLKYSPQPFHFTDSFLFSDPIGPCRGFVLEF